MGAFNHTSGNGAVLVDALGLNADPGAPAGHKKSSTPKAAGAAERHLRPRECGHRGSDVSYSRYSDSRGQLSHFERDVDIA
jgi:hypothetical protein